MLYLNGSLYCAKSILSKAISLVKFRFRILMFCFNIASVRRLCFVELPDVSLVVWMFKFSLKIDFSVKDQGKWVQHFIDDMSEVQFVFVAMSFCVPASFLHNRCMFLFCLVIRNNTRSLCERDYCGFQQHWYRYWTSIDAKFFEKVMSFIRPFWGRIQNSECFCLRECLR